MVKVGIAALLGTSFAGAFYLQTVQPEAAGLTSETSTTRFDWTAQPTSLPEGGPVLTALPIGPQRDPFVRSAKTSFSAGEPAPIFVRTPEVFAGLDVATLARLERERSRGVALADAGARTPGPLDILWALRHPAPDQVYREVMADPSPEVGSGPAEVPGAELPAGRDPERNDPVGEGNRVDDLLDVSATVAPEPATLALLAGGLLALSIVGFTRKRYR